MSKLIGIVGNSGTGKSSSVCESIEEKIKGLPPEETFLISVTGQGLPCRGWRKMFTPFRKEDGKYVGNYLANCNPSKICGALSYIDKSMPHIKYIVIDDSCYVGSFEFMDRALEKGFEKFNEIGAHIFSIYEKGRSLRDDIKVFIMAHPEETVVGMEVLKKIKTVGE